MGRLACYEKMGLKKGPWTPEEDRKLLAYVEEFGHGSWRALPAKAGLQRCGKSCRMRWMNYLRPDIKRGRFSLQEEQTIIQLHALLGNRWSVIASHLPKRTDNEVKNHWNTHLKKRLTKLGIDPVTHKPKNNALRPDQLKDAANLSHMAQWESTRLEAEARLTRKSNLQVQSAQLAYQPICLDVVTAWQGSWLKAPTSNDLAARTFAATSNSLDYLTSALNFSKKGKAMMGAKLGISNDFQYPKEGMDIKLLQLQGLGISANDGSMATENENIRLPNFVEAGLGDILFDNSNQLCSFISSGNSNIVAGTCYDDFEESDNYWNNILNLVNRLPSGSLTLF